MVGSPGRAQSPISPIIQPGHVPNQTSASNIVTKLTPSETAIAIRKACRTGRALFVWGPPGISKSATATQVADQLGIAFIDVRLSQMDPADLRGMPYPATVGGVEGLEWSAPLVLPRDLDFQVVTEIPATETIIRFYNPKGDNEIHICTDPQVTVLAVSPDHVADTLHIGPDFFIAILRDKQGQPVEGRITYTVKGKARAIVALEEFNSANQTIQAASYQLILNRRVGNYLVPQGCHLVAMGNRETDKAIAYRISTALSNRFSHVEMEQNHPEWMRWATNVGAIHPDVTSFIGIWEDYLFQFNPEDASKAFPTPRTWEFVSDYMKDEDELIRSGDETPGKVLSSLIAGTVGVLAATMFLAHRRQVMELPDVSAILSGKLKKSSKPLDVSLASALASRMFYQLQKEISAIKVKYNNDRRAWRKSPEYTEYCARGDNVFAFMIANFAPELQIAGARMGMLTYELPFDGDRMPNYVVFSERHRDLL